MNIVENQKAYLPDFIRLNEEWIAHYFTLEDTDRALASGPEKTIEDGGYIFSMVSDECVLGVCALFQHGDGVFELARMAVSPLAQGNGLGRRLMQACLDKLHSIRAKRVYLVSNTCLTAAICLYESFGFEVTFKGRDPKYVRANIVMERHFT